MPRTCLCSFLLISAHFCLFVFTSPRVPRRSCPCPIPLDTRPLTCYDILGSVFARATRTSFILNAPRSSHFLPPPTPWPGKSNVAPPGQGALCPTGLHEQRKAKRQLLPKPAGQGRRNWDRSEAESPSPRPSGGPLDVGEEAPQGSIPWWFFSRELVVF